MAGPIVCSQVRSTAAPASSHATRVPTSANRWPSAPAINTAGKINSGSNSVKMSAVQTDNAPTKEDKKTYILPDKQPGELPNMMKLTRPVINPAAARRAAIPSKGPSVEKKTLTVTNAFGNATAVTVSANLGATVRVDVDITLHVVTETSLKELTKTFEQQLTIEEKEEIRKSSSKIGGLGFFSRGFGIFGGKDTSYNENTAREYNLDNNERLNVVAEAFKSAQTADVKISGELEVEGVSLFYASEASILIEVLKVDIDGEEFLMVSEDPVAYDASRGEVLPPPGGPLTMIPL